MPIPPPRSTEQRRAAAQLALAARTVRATIRADLAARRMTLADVLALADDTGPAPDSRAAAVRGMRVRLLLEALPGIGERRADDLMAAAKIADSRRVGGLGPGQRERLLARLGDTGSPASAQSRRGH